MKSIYCALFVLLVTKLSAESEIRMGEMIITEDAVHNPMEFKLEAMAYQDATLYVCYTGYLSTKAGSHEVAMQMHQKCADAGYPRSMIWLSQIYKNGYYVDENPALSAYWDMRAAEADNESGMFNYGIDLLRGYGVGRYVVAGQYWINRAADRGHEKAQILRLANYDVSVVTPDADEANP